ncbi:MAG: hypothetical protein WA892_13680 [Ornithinimicrobium sp.]
MSTSSATTTTTANEHPADRSAVRNPPARIVLAVLRVLFGFTFLWAFLDKLFGLGKATPSESAWLNGGDPTYGFLANNEGTFSSFFTGLAGQPWVTWLFMLGLLGIGVALVTGAGMRLAAISAFAMYLMMWLASFPLENNPFVDDHLTGALTVVLFALTSAGDTLGIGGWWQRTSVVRRVPLLR